MLQATLHMMQKKARSTGDFHPRFLLSPYTMSDLQKKILTHICTTHNASYETLMEEMRKDRITIMQSLRSLINYHYVDKKRKYPQLEKSKVIFFPTHKGKAFARLYLNVELTKMIEVKDKDRIEMYIEFIRQAFPSQYDLILAGLLNELEKGALEFNNKDAIEKDLTIHFFRHGILDLASNNANKSDSLSTKKSRILFKNLFSPKEVRELNEYLKKVRDNLDLYINQLGT
jgi:predicted transcriptional regulator